jgi:sodium/potassium-transporting ATPase subunit alpha
VIRTGDHTVIGQIASLTTNEEKRDSPLTSEINHFVHVIAAVAGVVAIIFFIVTKAARDRSWVYAFQFAIGIYFFLILGTFVSFVPEGLPATVTTLLSFAAKKMAKRNVLVKDLQAVETLGGITLLATDKTGTLTRNQMTVTYLWTGFRLFFATTQSDADSKVAEPMNVKEHGIDTLLHISTLCSRARFESNEGPIADRVIVGDATESGLYRAAAMKLDGFETAVNDYPKVFEIPFNSDNKWAMTIHKKPHKTGVLTLYLKGAPERVLKLCTTIYDGKEIVPLTDDHKKEFTKTYEFMASKGHRVLAFASFALPKDEFPEDFEFKKTPANYPADSLTFYGLVSLEDPPKHGVREAIGHCREAGIKVMMVTGDHPLTAEAIGRKINLMLQDTKEKLAAKRNCPISQVPEDDVKSIVIHGEKIDSLTDEDWDIIFSKEEIIFARTSPKHKLTIVKHAQSLGHLVGVTGDGVNDSPALKKADLGIAMNISGSDVSKEAASMILVDDNFASTVNGIEEGRLIFQNLKKSIQYTVSHTMPQVWANLLNVAVPLPLMMSNILILLTDLGFELVLSLTYIWDEPESKTGLMKLLPRKPVTPESIERTKRDNLDQGKMTLKDRLLSIFSAKYWSRMFEPPMGEHLVDKNLMSWSYLEAGSISTIGCITAFFVAIYYHWKVTPYDLVQSADHFDSNRWENGTTIQTAEGGTLGFTQAKEVVATGQSAYYISLFILQCFNLFICKARLGYPFGKYMFENVKTFIGVVIGAGIVGIFVYIPPLHGPLGTYSISPLIWLVPMAFGVFLWFYSIIRTLIAQYRSPIKYSDEISGLMMYPTRWSTRGVK